MFLGEVAGQAAWRSGDLTESRWLLEIPAIVIDELEAMATAALDAGIRGEQVRANTAVADPWLSSVKSPAVDELAATLRLLLEAGPGFALLRRLPVESYTRDEAALVYWALPAGSDGASSRTHAGRPCPRSVTTVSAACRVTQCGDIRQMKRCLSIPTPRMSRRYCACTNQRPEGRVP